MSERELLEAKCRVFYGDEPDIEKRLERLKDAFFEATNSGYCDAMANRLMAGESDSQTEYWMLACSLRYEIKCLCEIYKELLKKGE